MLTGAGSGYSRWGDFAIRAGAKNVTRDDWGAYVFLRDVESGELWSAGYQPSGVEPDSYEVTFTEDRAEFARRDGTITTIFDVVVSPEEQRRSPPRICRECGTPDPGHRAHSYAELVLAPPAADTTHPVFSKLFVQTEYLAKIGTILATRRRRSPAEPEIWAAHLAVVEGETVGEPEIEPTGRFLGRGREVRAPIAVMDGRPLSNTVAPFSIPSSRFAPRAGSAGQDGAHRLLDGSRVVP